MNQYLSKFGFQKPTINEPVSQNLGLIVVIPCFNEPDVIASIISLAEAEKPNQAVEVIVVVNHGENHFNTIKTQNEVSVQRLQNWLIENDPFFKLHIIQAFDLPKKHAGVGLARKIGMDEAVARFDLLNRDGLIICFDADSICATNYFTAIESHFKNDSTTAGAAIRYEHPIEGIEFDKSIYEGIINYELFLRYYNQGLKYANLPYAFHTVGSSMVARSSAYQKQGGMNKRKAGEDFYFLHKIIALGNFTEINTTKVIPSPRTSDRVPFGTGKAISDWVDNESGNYLTYDERIWDLIKSFQNNILSLQNKNLNDLSFSKQSENKSFINFLKMNNFNTSLQEIRANSTSKSAFLKRFFVWFNAFRVLKLVHHLRDEQYPNKPIFDQAKAIAVKQGFYQNETTNKALLLAYRNFEAK